MADSDSNDSLLSSATKLLTLYVVYVFLSGWAFLDYYFRSFGIDTKSVDISFHEILIKGFTVLFAEHSGWLWPIYILLIVLPLVLEDKLKRFGSLSKAGVGLLLVVLLLLVYLISWGAGTTRAALDKGDMSRLPGITFDVGGQSYRGKLLLFKGGTYFIHGVAPIGKTPNPIELSIYRADDLKEVKVTESANE